MGQEQTFLKINNTMSSALEKYVKLSQKHHLKVFESKKKNKKQFEEFMKTIRVRLSYLKYKWAKKLGQVLKSQLNQLYDQYCSVLISNIHKKGKQEQAFHPKQIQQIFIEEFSSKYSPNQEKHMSQKLVEDALQECKCFFMIMKWLKQIVSFQEDSYQKSVKQNLFKQKNKFCQNKFNNRQQKIYNLLILLLENYYDSCITEVVIAPKSHQSKTNLQFNSEVLTILKILLKQNTFKQKQQMVWVLIKYIQKSQDDASQLYQKVMRLCQVKKAYCMTRIIKQVGDIDIDNAWVEVQKITKKRAQSPLKRRSPLQKEVISIR